jgi:hypothetical protein
MFRRRVLLLWAVAACLSIAFGSTANAEGAPPGTETEVTVAASGAARLDGLPGTRGGNLASFTASALSRHALGPAGWFWNAGLRLEKFRFSAGPVTTLQSCAATLSLEVFDGEEAAAALTLRPGLYFARHGTSDAWDVPVDFTTGIPLTREFSGVVGVSNARFYHHALPVAGFVWTANPRVRLELVFPEPAVVIKPTPQLTLRIGGELSGGGFLDDTRPRATPVEFTTYRVLGSIAYAVTPHCRVTGGVGGEVERRFDAFRAGETVRGSGSVCGQAGVTFAR